VEKILPFLSVLSRRRFLGTAGAATLAMASQPAAAESASMPTETVALTVNGRRHALDLDPRVTLLDALREHLGLTGTKKGCDQGQCGACTVIVNGQRINSCLSLALQHEGDKVTTIEGLGTPDRLHPMQAAFVEHDGYQCGYCTPGQIISATAALAEQRKGELSIISWHTGQNEHPELSDDEIRERMSGNICRCGAYPNIVAAVRAAAKGVTA